MTPNLATGFRHYLRGFLASGWNGAIGSLAAILAVDSAAMTGATQQAHVLNAHEMVAAFCGTFLLHGIMWLKAHPLPEDFTDTVPPFAPANPPDPKP